MMQPPADFKRRTIMATILACVVLVVACGDTVADEALGDRLAETLVESLRKRALDRDRSDLPLPDDELLIEIDVDRQRPDEGFRVDLVDELVIGGPDEDPNYIFGSLRRKGFSLKRVAVDDSGRIYVLPFLNRATHVRVYGADGEFLHRFGRWGEGPGDLLYPLWLIVAGDQVLVFHRRTHWSIWDRAGSYLRDRQIFPAADRDGLLRVLPSNRVLAAHGLDDGSVVAMSPGIDAGNIRNPFAGIHVVASRFNQAGDETTRFFEVSAKAQPRIAASVDGEIYASFAAPQSGQYYVVAWTAAGAPRWFTVLQAPDHDARWAELRLDDAGHLFVMPSYRGLARNDPRRPVHVFTTGGRLVSSGYLNRSPESLHWQAVRAGKTYGARQSDTTREWEVVRYRVEISSTSNP